uniref:Acyltransferase n=1 Tax=Eutreptiella gymnastica TaxID=73025 RepID=A0A7S1HX58_9EUGL|mmetsp:Transcript_111996/g.194472  ORF Transcript_111996/g.194472 Transcript_111996/m.194472 type:complete len:479 (+) Transcript_111996:263-1699(+)
MYLHKLKCLQQGSDYLTDGVLAAVKARVLAFGSELDLLLPSADEVKRLARKIPIARAVEVKGRSHAMLQEVDIDLMEMMDKEGFYTRDLVMTGNGKGPLSIEAPTRKETAVANSRSGTDAVKTLFSPVFMSVGPDGKVQRGCGGIDWKDRPILIVANHQTLASDLGMIITKLYLDHGVLARGLAHPTVMGGPSAGPRTGNDDQGGAGSLGSTFRSFGAVGVSGRNLYDLLNGDEVALLFPGGVREAYKGKGEEYQLIWPTKPEFVRLASRFGATIIPLSAIGADDGLEMLLDSNDLLNLPVIGEQVRRRAEGIPTARAAANVPGMGIEQFISPVVVPKLTESRRYYFLFGAPIYTDCDMDRERCAAVYQEVQDSLAAGLEWLQDRREEDPYQFLSARAPREFLWGEQAPTFPSLEGAQLPWLKYMNETEAYEAEECVVDFVEFDESGKTKEQPEPEPVLSVDDSGSEPPDLDYLPDDM